MPAPVMFPALYLEYLAFVLLPGLAVISWMKHFKDYSLVEKLGLCFGLSLVIDNAVLFVATRFVPVSALLVHGVVLASLALIALKFSKVRGINLKVGRLEKLVLLFAAALAIVLIIHSIKYPIFPQYLPTDFRIHGKIAASLTQDPWDLHLLDPPEILYYGVHYQLAASLVLTKGEALVSVQNTMTILVALSLPLLYLGVSRFFGSKRVGVIASFLYLVPGSVWYSLVYTSGLYPNFFALIVMMLFLYALAEVRDGGSRVSWLLMSLVLFLMVFTHYSIVAVVPALAAAALVQAASDRKRSLRLSVVLLAFVLPFLGLLTAKPGLYPLLLNFIRDPGGAAVGGTYLSPLLAGVPVVSYLALALSDDVAFVIIWILAAVGIYAALRGRDPATFFALAMLVELLAAAPQSVGAWRFSYLAMLPLCLVASSGLDSLLPVELSKRQRLRRKLYSTSGDTVKWAAAIVCVSGLVLSGGPVAYMLSDAATDTLSSSQAQYNVYRAMYWLNDNVKHQPGALRMVSVTNWWWLYAEEFVGIQTTYDWQPDPLIGSQIAANRHALIIAVTDPSSEATLLNNSTNPAWDLYPGPVPMRLLYNNSNVRLYVVGG